MGGGPCDFSVSPSPFGLDFGTLDFGTSDSGLTITVVMFRLCMGTHFATCDHDAVHKICARSATRYTLLILLPRPGTHFIHTLKVITRDNTIIIYVATYVRKYYLLSHVLSRVTT